MNARSPGVPVIGEVVDNNSRRILADTSGQSAVYFACKRCLDVVIAAAALGLLAPFLVLIGLWIVIDSPGPAVFIQRRVGAKRRSVDGQVVWDVTEFSVYKFRSMTHKADQGLHREYIKAFVEGRVEGSSDAGSRFKLMDDPRVTRVGSYLRRTSVDEVPQLLNVLKGDMSLVGPRPVPTYEVAEYKESHYERLAAQPGITGIWQVAGRCQVPFEQMVRMDIEYVRTKSLWLDLRLLLLTVPAVLSGRGAE